MGNRIRRNYDENFKTKVVLEAFKERKTLAQLSGDEAARAVWIARQPNKWLEKASHNWTSDGFWWAKADNFRWCSRSTNSTSLPTNRTTKSRVGLSKKKVTEESIGFSTAKRKEWIEPKNSVLSIERQCDFLGLSRSSYYYQPCPESADNLALVREIDKLYWHYAAVKFGFVKWNTSIIFVG